MLNVAMTGAQPKSPPPGALPETNSGEVVTFDDLLVRIGKDKDRDAFIRLFEHFAPRVKSFLLKSLRDNQLADDLAQETMLTVWHRAKSYDPSQAGASTWIFTIARNKKIDHYRKVSRGGMVLPDLDIEQETPEDLSPDALAIRQQREEHIASVLKELPEEQAHIVRKAYFEDKSHGEIAEEEGLPLGTVKSRMRLALERLRYHIGDDI